MVKDHWRINSKDLATINGTQQPMSVAVVTREVLSRDYCRKKLVQQLIESMINKAKADKCNKVL